MWGETFSSNTKCCPCYRGDGAEIEIHLVTFQERCVLMNKSSRWYSFYCMDDGVELKNN